MSKTAKQNWCCSKCKSNEPYLKPLASKSTLITDHTDTNNVYKKTFNNLVKSVHFMSEKLYSFVKQLQGVVTKINNIKVENSCLKEENFKLKNEVTLLNKPMNVFEQKAINGLTGKY